MFACGLCLRNRHQRTKKNKQTKKSEGLNTHTRTNTLLTRIQNLESLSIICSLKEIVTQRFLESENVRAGCSVQDFSIWWISNFYWPQKPLFKGSFIGTHNV